MGMYEKLQECDGIYIGCRRQIHVFNWSNKKPEKEAVKNLKNFLLKDSFPILEWVVRKVYHLALAAFSCYTAISTSGKKELKTQYELIEQIVTLPSQLQDLLVF